MSHLTYLDIVNGFETNHAETGKRTFIKDMAYSLIPPHEPGTEHPKHAIFKQLADSAADKGHLSGGPLIARSMATGMTARSEYEPTNPTVLPNATLGAFQWVFLIRHPRRAIPSLYRCMSPPLCTVTGFTGLLRSDLGIEPLRELFDYVVSSGIVPREEIIVLDADALLDRPKETIEELCRRVNIEFDEQRMLEWTDEDREYAERAFEKWRGWHDDALESNSLRPRTKKMVSFVCCGQH